MTERAWLCTTLGAEERQHGGNDGYEDRYNAFYSFDSEVPNHGKIREDDLLVLRNRYGLIGLGRVERVDTWPDFKTRFRCPKCQTTDMKQRKFKVPKWRCGNGHEFAVRVEEEIPVTAFRAHYEHSWTPLPDAISAADLRSMCTSGAERHAIREIGRSTLFQRLAKVGWEPSFAI